MTDPANQPMRTYYREMVLAAAAPKQEYHHPTRHPCRQMTSLRRKTRCCPGFTLLEALVCLLIATSLLMLSISALQRWVRDAQITATINTFVAAIHLARQTAQVRAQTVSLCPSANGRQCDPVTDWSGGWLMRLGEPQAPLLSAGDILQQGDAAATRSIRMTANRRAFSFRPFTLRDTNGTLTFCDEQRLAPGRRVIISPTGRPRLSFGTEANAVMNCSS